MDENPYEAPQERISTDVVRKPVWLTRMDEKQLRVGRLCALGFIVSSLIGVSLAYGPFNSDARLQSVAWIFVGYAVLYACLIFALHLRARKHRSRDDEFEYYRTRVSSLRVTAWTVGGLVLAVILALVTSANSIAYHNREMQRRVNPAAIKSASHPAD
jgi:hypothetical protein